MAKGKSVTGEIIKLRKVRLSFPALDKPVAPKNMPEAKKAFSATFLLDPATQVDVIKQCVASIKDIRSRAWPQLGGKAHPKEGDIICYGKGETRTNEEGEIYNGYEGMYFVTAKNDVMPLLLDMYKKEITDPSTIEKMFYGGCYVDANINFWMQNNDAGKNIRCGLRIVRFNSDGEAFGGGRASVDEMDDIEEPDGLEGLDDDEIDF